MKKHITISIVSIALSLFAFQAIADDASITKPYTIGRSYIFSFASALPAPLVELPNGVAKVVEDSGNGWVKIEYSIFRTTGEDKKAKTINAEEILHSAWINLAHVVAIIDPEK